MVICNPMYLEVPQAAAKPEKTHDAKTNTSYRLTFT